MIGPNPAHQTHQTHQEATAMAYVAKLVLWWLCLAHTLSWSMVTSEDGEDSQFIAPTIQLIILVNPYNKASILPYSLGSIESQLYPKDRIKVLFKTERLTKEDSSGHDLTQEQNEFLRRNQLTINILRTWIRHNRQEYNEIELILGHQSVYNLDFLKYWTTDRFQHLIQMKNWGLELARKNWAHWALFIDSDVVLTNDKVFQEMTVNHMQIAKAPMLYSLGTYSNFWAGMTDKGYYSRTKDYLPILERQRFGEFVVPMIHSCVFINLWHKKSFNLTFDSRHISQEYSPFDDIIAFAKSAKISKIDLFVNNREVWGYIPPPIEKSADLQGVDQDIIDLQLESLVEGPEFPLSSSLLSYAVQAKTDKLNVDHIYVINLVRRPERRQRMTKCLEILGIEAQIWKAVDGKELSEEFLVSKNIKAIDGYMDPYHKRPMTYGEIGCFLSHYRVWEDMIANNMSKAIVLEDDVRFERDFKNRWQRALTRFDASSYDFLYLGRKIQHPNNESLVDELFARPYYSYWTIGYMITLRGALKLTAAQPLSKLIPVDEFLPIMYDRHPNQTLKEHFPIRDLNALSVSPLLLYPTHYVGDTQYFSDTEDSNKLTDEMNAHTLHPKHTEL